MLRTAGAGSIASGSVTAWDSRSEVGEPVTELMEHIFQALDRLACCHGEYSEEEGSRSV
jgi:hypothetical protein